MNANLRFKNKQRLPEEPLCLWQIVDDENKIFVYLNKWYKTTTKKGDAKTDVCFFKIQEIQKGIYFCSIANFENMVHKYSAEIKLTSGGQFSLDNMFDGERYMFTYIQDVCDIERLSDTIFSNILGYSTFEIINGTVEIMPFLNKTFSGKLFNI